MNWKYFLLQFSVSALSIFGGLFTIRYVRDGHVYGDLLLAACLGVVGLIVYVILKKKEKSNVSDQT